MKRILLFLVVVVGILFWSFKPSGAQESPLDQQTFGLIRAVRALQSSPAAERGRALEVLGELISRRGQLILSTMEADPAAVLRLALPSSIKRDIPQNLQSSIEEDVELEGSVEAMVADNFEEGTEKRFYFLNANNRKYELHFAEEGPEILSDTVIRLKGVALGDEVAVNGKNSRDFQIVRSPRVQGAVSQNENVLGVASSPKVAVIAINFTNNGNRPYTIDEIRRVVFTSTYSAKNYFNQNSFGQMNIVGRDRTDGDVYGWYTIPYSNSTCNFVAWGDAARSKAQAAGVDLTGYTNFIYVFPQTSACGWGGMGDVRGNDSYINGNALQATATYNAPAHELGHNYSTSHASGYNCTNSSGVRVPISSNCTVNTYGDPFDVMGNLAPHHMSNYHKGAALFLDPANTQIVSSAGTYTILPIETRSSGVQSLLIPKERDSTGAVTKYYYLEFRQPQSPFDVFNSTNPVINGVTIRIAPPYETYFNSFLIDTTAGTSSFNDASLAIGRSFTDPAIGATITTTSVSPTSAQVNVTFAAAACVRANPTVSISPLGQWGNPGQSLNYTLSVTNNDSSTCGNSTFNTSSIVPSGFTQGPGSITLAPGATSSTNIAIASGSNTAEGTYSFTETVTNNAATSFRSSVQANYNVIYPPVVGDANGDRLVNETDYSVWRSHYNQSVSGPSNGDFDNNARVDGLDYSIWLTNYSSAPTTPGPTSVPTTLPTPTPVTSSSPTSCINTTCYQDADGDGFRSANSATRCVVSGNCSLSTDNYNKKLNSDFGL